MCVSKYEKYPWCYTTKKTMLCSFKSKLRTWMFEICSSFWDFTKLLHFWAASKNLCGILACENSRLSSLLAARESFRQEGRDRDCNSILMTKDLCGIWSGALIGRRSSYIVLAVVYEWPTKTKGHEGQMKMWWIYYKTVNIPGIYSSLQEASEFCWSSFAEEPKTLP